MRFSARSTRALCLFAALALVSALACSLLQPGLEKQYLPVIHDASVTQVVAPPAAEVTRLVPGPTVEVVQTVEVPRTVEVTRLVEIPAEQVVQTVEVTRLVTVTQIVYQPAPTSVPPLQHVYYALPLYYDFEGDFLASGVVADRSGNGHDARIVGTVEETQGISGGQAIQFNGNGYIQAQGNPMAERKSVTFALWFKTDHPEANYKLASAAWGSGGLGSGWILGTQIPEFWSDDTRSLFEQEITNNENNFSAGEWVFEVITYDGSRIKEYTNARLVNNWLATGAGIGEGQAMVVGGWPSFGIYNFVGSIDEFRLYDRVLTLEEIRALYNQEY